MSVVSAARVDEILAALTAAKAGWPNVARKLPEFARLSYGKPMGTGIHRPWVLLEGQHEEFDLVPIRLVRFETGVWFMKGEYARDIERKEVP